MVQSEIKQVETLEERTMRKVKWRLLPFLIFLYLVAYIDRANIGFAALDMNKALGISAATYGVLSGLFYLGYIPFEVPSNVMLHRFGARKWIARIMISWGIVVMFTGWVQNLTHLYVLRLLLGAAEAGFYPGILLYLSFWFPQRLRGQAVALFMTAIPVSSFIGAPLSTLILDNIRWFGIEGWRWMFILEGIPAILIGIFVLYYLTDRPEQAEWLSEEERTWLSTEKQQEHQAKVEVKQYSKLQAFLSPKVWRLAIIYLTLAAGQIGIVLWLPTIIKGFSQTMTNTQVGLLTMIPYFCATIVMIIWSRHSDKTGERKFHAAFGPFVAACALIVYGMSLDLITKMIAMTITVMGIYCFYGPFWSLPSQFLSEGAAAVGIATINSVGMIGGFVGPAVIGYFTSVTGNSTAGLYAVCGALLVNCLLVATMPLASDKK